MTNILTAQDIANYIPDLDTSAYSATTLSGIISQVQRKAAQFCSVKGFEFQAEEDIDRALINDKGELAVFIQRRPVVSVQSIQLKRGSFSVNLTLTDGSGNSLLNIPSDGARLYLPNAYLYATGSYLAGGSSQLLTLKAANMFCDINYYGGYQSPPDDLKDALLLWVQDTITRSVNRAGVKSFTQGSLSMSFGSGGAKAPGDSFMVQEAKQILTQGGYVRPEIF